MNTQICEIVVFVVDRMGHLFDEFKLVTFGRGHSEMSLLCEREHREHEGY